MTSVWEAGLGAKPADVLAKGPALPAEVTGRLVDEGVLGIATGAGLAAGCGDDRKGSGALQPTMAPIPPHRALLMCCHSVSFSASMSLAVTL